MSDLNIRNNLHTGIEFDAQGSNLVATVTPETVGAAPAVHDHPISEIQGLQDALDQKLDVGGDFDSRYLRIDGAQSISGLERSNGRNNLGLGTVATYNVPVNGDAASDEVVLGNDSRLAGGGGGGSGAVQIDVGNMSGATSIDFDGERVVHAFGTLVGDSTLSFDNAPSTGVVLLTLAVTQDSTGSRTLTLPGGVEILNGGDGSVDPSSGSTTWLTFACVDGDWSVGVSDSRLNDYDDFYLNPPANGDYRVGFRKPRTLDFSDVEVIGGATVAFHKSDDGGSSWGGALTGEVRFDRGDLLSCAVTNFDSFCTITISRVA